MMIIIIIIIIIAAINNSLFVSYWVSALFSLINYSY